MAVNLDRKVISRHGNFSNPHNNKNTQVNAGGE